MKPVNRNLNQFIKRTLYRLKHDFGAQFDIYKLTGSTTDVTTGDKTITKTVTHIRRGPVLPATISRDVNQSISEISSNKSFVMGGTYDAAKRVFIVDRRDAPNLSTLTADDWIVYDGRKWQIASVEEFEVHAGWLIKARELVGEVPEQIFDLLVESDLILEETAGAS